MTKMSIVDQITIASVVGAIAGVLFSCGLNSCTPPMVNRAKIYQRDSKPAVMRLDKLGRDGILVENPEKKGEYIRLDMYLGEIKNEYDRKIERTEIERAVRWNEE